VTIPLCIEAIKSKLAQIKNSKITPTPTSPHKKKYCQWEKFYPHKDNNYPTPFTFRLGFWGRFSRMSTGSRALDGVSELAMIIIITTVSGLWKSNIEVARRHSQQGSNQSMRKWWGSDGRETCFIYKASVENVWFLEPSKGVLLPLSPLATLTPHMHF
jgi:hypothetical protein